MIRWHSIFLVLLIPALAIGQAFSVTNDLQSLNPATHPIHGQVFRPITYAVVPVIATNAWAAEDGFEYWFDVYDGSGPDPLYRYPATWSSGTARVSIVPSALIDGWARLGAYSGTSLVTYLAWDNYSITQACTSCSGGSSPIINLTSATYQVGGVVSSVTKSAGNAWDPVTGALTVGTNYPSAYGVTNQPAGVPTLTAGGALLIGTNVPASAGGAITNMVDSATITWTNQAGPQPAASVVPGALVGVNGASLTNGPRTLLGTFIADGTTNAFTFAAIPQTYRRLVLEMTCVVNYPTNYGGTSTVLARPNNNSAAIYQYGAYNFANNTPSTIYALRTNVALFAYAPFVESAAHCSSIWSDYASTNNKVWSFSYGGGITTAFVAHVVGHGFYLLPSPVTSLNVWTASSSNFTAGAAYLYGEL